LRDSFLHTLRERLSSVELPDTLREKLLVVDFRYALQTREQLKTVAFSFFYHRLCRTVLLLTHDISLCNEEFLQ